MSKQIVNRKRLWLLIGLGFVVVIGCFVMFFGWINSSGKAVMRLNEEEGLLIISNDQYEAAFRADNGGIEYVKQKGANEALTLGNQTLWRTILSDDTTVQSINAESFSYEWTKKESELKLHYGGAIAVDIAIQFGEDHRIYLAASIDNTTGQIMKSFQFPYELKFNQDSIEDAILPMLPGAKLNSAFFQESNSFYDQYPGVMFASYLAMRTSGGNLAMYDLSGETIVSTELGYKHQINDSGKTSFVHNYKTWIQPEEKWSSPTVVLELETDYPTSIISYRELNEIDEYRSLADKLGEKAEAYFELPLYKTDISALKDANWSSLTSDYINKMDYSGMIHLVGFQTGGHDENYPDFMPPDSKWGGDAAFQAFMSNAKEKGNIVVPYTNMSWWGIHSPTLQQLPTGTKLEDIIVNKENGTIIQEDYGQHSGYVANAGHPFFRERIAEEHSRLINNGGFDGIFEDQWGIRNAMYAHNEMIPEGTDPSTAYFKGVQNYFSTLQHHMYIEDGTDVLANDSIGFMGSTYLWDLLGYRKNTASYTEYYPLSGMLMRDKVMFYHHNLAGETMTDDPDMLRWNVAMGYNLSTDFYNGITNPWVAAIGVFQKYVLAQYADQRVRSFEQLAEKVTQTDFGTHKVTANWDSEVAYELEPDIILSPGGFDIKAVNGNVRAGNYSRYNGLDLDAGGHHLVEVRGEDAIKIYQPIGYDTTLKIEKGQNWSHIAAVAYQADGTKIADLSVEEQGEYAIFDYVASIKEQKVGYVELSSSSQPSGVTELFPKVKVEINLALGKQTSASSMTAEAFDPKMTTDGDPFTYWESTANKFPQSLTVDLGEEKSVSKLKLRLPPQDAWEQRTQEIEVSGSKDGVTFDILSPSAAYTYDPKSGNEVEIMLGNTLEMRQIRVTITSNSAWPAAQVSELEVY